VAFEHNAHEVCRARSREVALARLDVGAADAIHGPIDRFGENYTPTVGVLGQFSINKQLAIGAP
jgi:hypothetical protein